MSWLIRLAKCTPILYCLAFYISWGFMPTCCRPMTLGLAGALMGLNIGGCDGEINEKMKVHVFATTADKQCKHKCPS